MFCAQISVRQYQSKIGATWTAFHEYFVMTLMLFTSVPLQTKPEKCNSVSHNMEVRL